MRQFLLAAGVDFNFSGIEFRKMCETRLKQLLRNTSWTGDFRARIFDFHSGRVLRFDGSKGRADAATSMKQQIERQFVPITSASYEKNRLKPDVAEKAMSVTHLYGAVWKINLESSGTLEEFSVFSHGFEKGPVLVNTDDNRLAPGRSSTDNDPRLTDFEEFSDLEKDHFRSAFSKSGYIWLWGCDINHDFNSLFAKIERAAGGDPDTNRRIVISNLSGKELKLLKRFLPRDDPDLRIQNDSASLVLKKLLSTLCRLHMRSYAIRIAGAADVRTFAAILGTSADLINGDKDLMHIVPGFARRLKFYQLYLGVKLDPEGKRYVEHTPDFKCTKFED